MGHGRKVLGRYRTVLGQEKEAWYGTKKSRDGNWKSWDSIKIEVKLQEVFKDRIKIEQD